MASKKGNTRGRPRAQTRERDKLVFKIYVKLFTGEKFSLKNVSNDMKVRDLKTYMEFSTGVPVHMQRISYLDDGELLDHTDIRSNDIVAGATLQMRVWPMWKDLIEACATNDLDWVFRLGVSQPTTYHTPGSDYMTKRARKNWLDERAFLALFIASHRGHENLVRRLIDSGANVDACTPLGRTSLHVAAAQGHGHIVDLLLEKGADIDAEEHDGLTALTIASKFGHKTCERHLFLFRWQQRAKRTKPSQEPKRMAHQFFDSSFPVWKTGSKCQLYFMNILPPGEYEGTRFDSPKKQDALTLEEMAELEAGGKLPAIDSRRTKSGPPRLRKGPSFNDWLNRKRNAEQKIIDIKKAAEEKMRQEEEERQRQEAEKSESYENWLANKEAEKTNPGSHSQTSKTRQPHYDMQAPDMMSRQDGYLRSYLRSLDERKRGNNYFNFEEWLNEKEENVLGIRRQRTQMQT